MLYICGKGKIRKNRIVHAIELGCTLLLQEFDFVINALIDTSVDNISSSIFHISFAIGVKKRYGTSNNDKLNM